MRKLLLLLLLFSIPAAAQNDKKMKRNLTFTLSDNFNPNSSFSFTPQNPGKHGFDRVVNYFTQSFEDRNLSVRQNSDYIISMEYYYIYKVAYYKMQYANMNGLILDRKTNELVGKFFYDGNFNVSDLAEAIAKKIAKRRKV